MVKRYGIDIDGVLADFPSSLAQTMHHAPEPISTHNLILLASPPKDWNWAEPLVGKMNWDWFWNEGCVLNRTFATAEPIGKELHWLHLLPGEVFLITSRPKYTQDQTYAWMAKHEVSVEGVLHVSHPSEKAEFLRDLDIDVFVDDHPATVPDLYRSMDKVPREMYIFDQPWNRQVEWVPRIRSLRELI